MMKSSRSNQRNNRSRKATRFASSKKAATNHKDDDDTETRYFYDTDDDLQSNDDDDDEDISLAPTVLVKEAPQSTTDVVEESKIQVHFCETTVNEMDQILEWWTSKAWMEGDDNQDSIAAHNNSLLRLEDQEEEDTETSEGGDNGNKTTKDEKEHVAEENPMNAHALQGDAAGLEDFRDTSNNDRRPSESSLSVSVIGKLACDSFRLSDALANSASGAEEMPDFSLRSFSSSNPEELHRSVKEQHLEVKRLLFQTQDMVDQVAALTSTEEDEDDDDQRTENSSKTEEEEEQVKMISPSKLAPPRSRRRQRRKALSYQSSSIPPCSNSDDSSVTTSCMQLRWKDHAYIWVFRQVMRLELCLIDHCLIPTLPLPVLLFVLKHPKPLRTSVWIGLILSLTAVFMALSILMWFVMMKTGKPPALDFAVHEATLDTPPPLHYDLKSINPFRGALHVLKGELDFCLI